MDDFWKRVRKTDGCWEWRGTKKGAGSYGRYKHDGKMHRAHRFAYVLTHGPIPDGLLVLHSCDNRGCVNPQHLRLGTAKDNVRDAVLRERMANTKLSWQKVREIRRLYDEGHTNYRISRMFEVDAKTIRGITLNLAWIESDTPCVQRPSSCS